MRSVYVNNLLGKSNRVIKALTLSDFSLNSSGALSGVIFTLFVVQYIEGATFIDVGLTNFVFFGVSALLNIPLGKWMDSKKGYIDEDIILSTSMVIRGISLILLSFSTQLYQLYILQALLGIARSMNFTSWRAIFSKYLDQKHIAAQWSTYDTIVALALGLSTLVGGYMADIVPFTYIILISGIVSLVGGIFPLLVIHDISDDTKKEI